VQDALTDATPVSKAITEGLGVRASILRAVQTADAETTPDAADASAANELEFQQLSVMSQANDLIKRLRRRVQSSPSLSPGPHSARQQFKRRHTEEPSTSKKRATDFQAVLAGLNAEAKDGMYKLDVVLIVLGVQSNITCDTSVHIPVLDNAQVRVYARQLQDRIDELERANIDLQTANSELKLAATTAATRHSERERELLMKIKSQQRLVSRATGKAHPQTPVAARAHSAPTLSLESLGMAPLEIETHAGTAQLAKAGKNKKKGGYFRRLLCMDADSVAVAK
jgi:hypothetical protein